MMRASRATMLLALLAAGASDTARGADEAMFDPNSYEALVSEKKAAHVGDILTVIVQEDASATAASDLQGDRKASLGAGIGSSNVGTHELTASLSNATEGGGRTERSGRLTAQLSVRVDSVTAAGDLNLSGRQQIVVNGEAQTIALTGTVRVRDVGADNTILSSKIADAQIEFNGEGYMADESRPGWLSRLLARFGF